MHFKAWQLSRDYWFCQLCQEVIWGPLFWNVSHFPSSGNSPPRVLSYDRKRLIFLATFESLNLQHYRRQTHQKTSTPGGDLDPKLASWVVKKAKVCGRNELYWPCQAKLFMHIRMMWDRQYSITTLKVSWSNSSVTELLEFKWFRQVGGKRLWFLRVFISWLLSWSE